ncbi:hypothetical protein PE067_17690 [Paracoccus sp. DMF-8]|uniref:hypothetical protein n=1 Tax=Paracoccus sp. DMF-8 TaxID=3019445 RepID=UPI0023E363DF|nr:hypothetical protein [Paracoccus sp. DMF-8]MDF3607810.1 hypothetical protein [Paracoccus sp. DMF-8]
MTELPTDPQAADAGGDRDPQQQLDQLLAQNRDTLQGVLRVWLVRVVLVTAVMFALDRFMGPVRWFRPLIGIYAVVSLTSSLALHRLKNRQMDRLRQLAGGQAE